MFGRYFHIIALFSAIVAFCGFPPIGIPEMMIIVFVMLLLFGAKRLPEMGRSLGGGIKEFKKSLMAPDDEDDNPPEKIKDSDTEAHDKV